MATTPLWAGTPKTGMARCTAAVAVRDGTDANQVTVFTAGASGAVITAILAQSSDSEGAAITAGLLRLYITGGGNTRLVKEVPLSGSSSNSVAGPAAMLTPGNGLPPGGLRLQAGYSLVAGVSVAEPVTVIADYGDF